MLKGNRETAVSQPSRDDDASPDLQVATDPTDSAVPYLHDRISDELAGHLEGRDIDLLDPCQAGIFQSDPVGGDAVLYSDDKGALPLDRFDGEVGRHRTGKNNRPHLELRGCVRSGGWPFRGSVQRGCCIPEKRCEEEEHGRDTE